MTEKKKPDNIVFDADSEKYDASLKPYTTNVGAPAIRTNDTTAWKNRNINKVNKQISAKYMELKAEYEAMMEQMEYNNLVYGAKFNFEPVVGEVYHLYRDKEQQPFLSLIAPNECNFDHAGSFRLNAEQMWEKL